MPWGHVFAFVIWLAPPGGDRIDTPAWHVRFALSSPAVGITAPPGATSADPLLTRYVHSNPARVGRLELDQAARQRGAG